MTNAIVSDELMQEFLTAATANQGSTREQYLLRETFYSLLRLARSEQLMDIRTSVNRLVPASLRPTAPRKSRGRVPHRTPSMRSTLWFSENRNEPQSADGTHGTDDRQGPVNGATGLMLRARPTLSALGGKPPVDANAYNFPVLILQPS